MERLRESYTLRMEKQRIPKSASLVYRISLRKKHSYYSKRENCHSGVKKEKQIVMSNYSKYNIIHKLQKWMDSITGQTFLNYAYSWGAAVVILGTLFKLTHIPGANMILFIGMGTEVIVFFFSAFDRPFDKTTEDMDLKHDNVAVPPVQTLDNSLTAQLNARLEDIEALKKKLSDGKETEEIRDVMTAIHQTYQQHLSKLNSQLTSIEKMDELFKIQNAYLSELNKIYERILEAMGGNASVRAANRI